MSFQKNLFTLVIASMLCSQTVRAEPYERCDICDFEEGCGYSDCRRSTCLLVAFATGAAVFTGLYFIILNDSNGSHGHHSH